MKREDVREQFPQCVKIADKLKAAFDQIHLRHVNENGKTMGKQSPAGIKLSEIELSGDWNFKKEAK